MKKIIAGALSLLIGMSAGSLAWGALNGSSTTITTSTLCNNGAIEQEFAGTFSTTCGSGWTVGELETSITTFLDYDDGDGQAWDGWTWDINVGLFGDEGWKWTDTGAPWGACVNASSYCLPMSFGKSSVATGVIDTTQRAPSTSTGGSLYITESGAGQQADWWIWQGGKSFGDYGTTNSDTDRLSFYLKLEGNNATDPDDPQQQNLHIGTYLCDPSDCPSETAGHHYYHWLGIGGSMNDVWVHIQLDKHPQHSNVLSLNDPRLINNPGLVPDGLDYYESMMQIYVAMEGSPQAGTTSFTIDELEFFNQTEEQNETSIVSTWVGYNTTDDWWEIGFMSRNYPGDEIPSGGNGLSLSTYEIRYSTEVITNANWSSATPIDALYMGDSEQTSKHAQAGVIRKASGTRARVWTRFTISDVIEAANDKLYFAIKDISVVGTGAGTGFTWQNHDYMNAPSSLIKTIDYTLRTP